MRWLGRRGDFPNISLFRFVATRPGRFQVAFGEPEYQLLTLTQELGYHVSLFASEGTLLGTTYMATRAIEQRSRRYDPAETRQRVLEAANMLFSTKGFVATGTADIARQADVSEGSIFYHFGSKRNLLTELGRMYGERMVQAMHMPGEDIADVEPGLSISRCFDYCATHKAWEAIMTNGGEDVCPQMHKGGHHHPEAEPFYRASREVVIEWAHRQIQAVIDRTGHTEIHAPSAASMTYAVVSDALDRAFSPGVGESDREIIKREAIRFVRAATRYVLDDMPARQPAND